MLQSRKIAKLTNCRISPAAKVLTPHSLKHAGNVSKRSLKYEENEVRHYKYDGNRLEAEARVVEAVHVPDTDKAEVYRCRVEDWCDGYGGEIR